MSRRLAIVAVLAVRVILCRPVDAQVPTGIIAGRVTDATGASIPHARVAISKHEDGQRRVLETTKEGEYTAPSLQAGVYEVAIEAPGFERLSDVRRPALAARPGAIRTAKLPAKLPRHAGPGDPTGCGDVWGATYFSRLLAGDKLDAAIDRALDAAARNVDHRGATGLADYLRGELSIK